MANTTLPFNEFQRELERQDIPSNVRYVLTLMYEQLIEVDKQADAAAKIMLQMAQTMEHLTLLHGDTQKKVFEFQRSQRDQGIEVKSVMNEPERDN